MATLQDLPSPGTFQTTQQIRDARLARKLAERRRRMLLWSAPFVLLAFLAALKLLSGVLITWAGMQAHEQGSYSTAASRFSSQQWLNVVEPYRAYYNEGTSLYASGAFFAASQELEHALELVPKNAEQPGEDECNVRTNLSLSYEGLGDEAAAAADPAMAQTYYQQARDTLSSCSNSDAQDASERQEEKQEEQQQQQEQQEGGEGDPSENPSSDPSQDPSGDPSQDPSQDPSGDPSGDPSQDPSGDPSESPSSGDPQQEELEERNREAEQQRQEEEQQQGGGSGGGQGW